MARYRMVNMVNLVWFGSLSGESDVVRRAWMFIKEEACTG